MSLGVPAVTLPAYLLQLLLLLLLPATATPVPAVVAVAVAVADAAVAAATIAMLPRQVQNVTLIITPTRLPSEPPDGSGNQDESETPWPTCSYSFATYSLAALQASTSSGFTCRLGGGDLLPLRSLSSFAVLPPSCCDIPNCGAA